MQSGHSFTMPLSTIPRILVLTSDTKIADKDVRASSNPPSVLSGIPLSSQPELVQDLPLCLALLHPGRQFHSSIRNLRLFAITVLP
jgi:hypothetical protein